MYTFFTDFALAENHLLELLEGGGRELPAIFSISKLGISRRKIQCEWTCSIKWEIYYHLNLYLFVCAFSSVKTKQVRH